MPRGASRSRTICAHHPEAAMQRHGGPEGPRRAPARLQPRPAAASLGDHASMPPAGWSAGLFGSGIGLKLRRDRRRRRPDRGRLVRPCAGRTVGITDSEASPKPPAFVEDALHSHETALLRARMVSQPQTAGLRSRRDPGRDRHPAAGPAEGLARASMRRCFPSRYGHSVEIAIDAGRARAHVAVRGPRAGLQRHRARRSPVLDGATAAYWQTGQLAYALTGSGSDKAIERAADPAVPQAFSKPSHRRTDR